MEDKYITVVDIGTYKTSVCTATVNGKNISISAYKEDFSNGTDQGKVFNPKQASEVVSSLIGQVENELGIKIRRIITGIPGYGIANESVTIEKERADEDAFVSEEELLKMTSEIYSSQKDSEEIYSVIPQYFSIGDAKEISFSDTVGMAGKTIAGKYRVFSGPKSVFDNNRRVFKNLKLEVAEKYLHSIAAAEATLYSQEKHNGVALINFGGKTTDLLIYYKNIIRYVYTLPFGGMNITTDIANECKISEDLAESIKRDFGFAMPDKLFSLAEKSLKIESGRGKEVPVRYLSEIIETRCREIFDAILYHIEMSGLADELNSGIVLTGGSANLMAVADLLKSMSGYNVRRAVPNGKYSKRGFDRLGEYSASTLMGLLMLAVEDCAGYDTGEAAPADNGTLFGNITSIDENDQAKGPKPAGNTTPFQPKKKKWFTKIIGGGQKNDYISEDKKSGDFIDKLFGDDDNV